MTPVTLTRDTRDEPRDFGQNESRDWKCVLLGLGEERHGYLALARRSRLLTNGH
jgi:hypothetical protein